MSEVNQNSCDVIVIGAGIAGASVAAQLPQDKQILLLERESQPGYHTTGRSAAIYTPVYGPQPIRALTRASGPFFKSPPLGFTDQPLLSPRAIMMLARADQQGALQDLLSEVQSETKVTQLDAAATRKRQPLLRDGYADGAMLDEGGYDIDVDALLQGYLRVFKSRGGVLKTRCDVLSMTPGGGVWTVETSQETLTAPVVINAAGAWAEQMGALAGATRIGLTPKRRSVLIVAAPDGVDTETLPLSVDIDEGFYLKPDAGRLLISPANEDPSEPCDVQPDEMDIAICVDRIETAFDLNVRRIENKWAGLRSFVADKCPVVGFDAQAEGFFWLAGQGGYGIQTAPALGRVAAALAMGAAVPQDILDHGFDPLTLSPTRVQPTS